ncbi:MAG: ATPase P [Saccharofermentans sp.]|nr:ATPase P [Saccharofermentans sp.]
MVKTTLKIDGMMCGMCEAHVNDIVRKAFPNASKVKSSHRKGECSFVTAEPVDGNAVKDALNEMGYKLLDVKTENYEKRGLFG